MRYLFDTQLLVLGQIEQEAVPERVIELVNLPGTEISFSIASLWEVAIKFGRGKPDFNVDPARLRFALLRHGYKELAITSEHVIYVTRLPAIHKDPFDRILMAQATVEGITLLTSDSLLSQYPGPVLLV